MGDRIFVENRGLTSTPVSAALGEALELHTTMEKALAWFFAQSPPLHPEDLVAQDEFSFDLIVPVSSSVYLAYSTC